MHHLIDILYHIPHLLKKLFGLVGNQESYYPELPQKNRVRKLMDLMRWAVKNGEINKYYYLYGFDVDRPTDMDLYSGYRTFMKLRAQGNKNGSDLSQVVLLRDKYLFYQYMKGFQLPVPEVFAARIGGRFLDNELNPISEEALLGKRDYFAKDLSGECGNLVRHIKDFDELLQYKQDAGDADFILQEKVEQHGELRRLNPLSVNTLRIVTVMTKDGPTVFSAVLRIGTATSGDRDNTSQGGIAVGIHEDGTLMEFGVCKPQFGGRTTVHPDTGVVFASVRIPFFRETLTAVCRAHECFYRVRSIGWDIAVTPEGPVFIEGNDNWELQTIQAIYGGQRERCLALLP